jgi:hypothetical protein
MHHVWSVLCSHSLIDQETNNISLFGVLEQISATGPPVTGERQAVPINCELVTLWSRSIPDQSETGRFRLRCETPNTLLFESEGDIDLTNHRRRRLRAKIDLLPVPETATYYFRMCLWNAADNDWCEVAAIPLDVEINVQE